MTSLVKMLAALAVFLSLPFTPASAQNGPFTMKRAVNMAQWFTWPRYEATGEGIQWPPYKAARGSRDESTLTALREAGFDTVRLPVDPAPFIVFQGDRKAAVYEMLFATIARIKAAGLNTIVDIHPNSRHAVWGQHAVIKGLEASTFRAVANVIEEMARRLNGHTASVALELLNEPRLKCEGREQQLWQEMAQHLAQRARTVNPELTLIVTGACVASVEGLVALGPTSLGRSNTIYTFHYYEPFSFTHQGAQFIPWPDKYLDGVPWPSTARPISEPTALLDRHLNSLTGMNAIDRMTARTNAMHNLQRYYRESPGASFVDKRLRKVAEWAQRYGVPPANIFIGEFGVMRRGPGKPGAFCEDRIRWHRDVRDVAETYGFSWAYFSYDGPFGLVEDGQRELDPLMLAALGLKSSCGATAAVGGGQDGAARCRCPAVEAAPAGPGG
jgi:endoglucanase